MSHFLYFQNIFRFNKRTSANQTCPIKILQKSEKFDKFSFLTLVCNFIIQQLQRQKI